MLTLQTAVIACLVAAMAVIAAWPYLKFPDLTAMLSSLRRNEPADRAEPAGQDPAELLIAAARLYLLRGETAKAVKVFALAAEPDVKGGAA
jgi:hypothetical protein